MSEPAYAAVDWGTSSFRLWLIGRDGRIVAERRSGEGMTTAAEIGFAAVLEAHLAATSAPDDLPVVVCGMAGARQGWVEAGYVHTPARLDSILAGAVPVPGQRRDVRILPGIAQCRTDAPDVLRGEETQLLGIPEGGGNDLVVCMPGTHSKWGRIVDGRVEEFATFMTGELFDAIGKATILSHAVAHASSQEENEAFRHAVLAAHQAPARAANLLFQVRARQLLFAASPEAARETISGTLIGLEIAGGMPPRAGTTGVTLIASGRLGHLYRTALETLAIPTRIIDADDAVLRGLAQAAKLFWAF